MADMSEIFVVQVFQLIGAAHALPEHSHEARVLGTILKHAIPQSKHTPRAKVEHLVRRENSLSAGKMDIIETQWVLQREDIGEVVIIVT